VADTLQENMVIQYIKSFHLKNDYSFSFQTLRVLDLSFNQISDTTLEHLYELFQEKNVTVIFVHISKHVIHIETCSF